MVLEGERIHKGEQMTPEEIKELKRFAITMVVLTTVFVISYFCVIR